MKNKLLLTISIVFMTISSFAQSKPTLVFYSGIAMVKPIKEMAKIIEDRYNCTIKISQGGSKDLYDSIKFSKKGDLYLPGSESYRLNNLKDGFLLESVYIGYNQAAIFVKKGNPLNIKNIDAFIDERISSTLCNPNSGSIGRMTEKIFIKHGGEEFFEKAYDNATLIGTDSRNLNRALIDGYADLTINWRTTAYWDENSKYIDILEEASKDFPKKKLLINLLSFSKHPEIAKKFMEFASSEEGKKIMKKYGFLD